MQDRDIPPEVVEGEASDDAGVVRRTVVARPTAATASNTAASTALPWTTATAPPWAGTTDRDRDGCVPDSLPLMLPSSLSRCLRAITATPASLPLLMIFSSRPRSRRRRAS